MRIAYFTINRINNDGGVPAKLAYQLEGWRAAGCEAELFCATDEVTDLGQMVEGTIVKRPRRSNPVQQFKSDREILDQLKDRLKKWRPDVIYSRWGYHRSVYCQLADEFPMIVELNGDVVKTAKLQSCQAKSLTRRFLGLYTGLTINKLLSRAAGFVCVTNDVAGLDYVVRQHKPTLVMPNSIDLSRHITLPPTDALQELPRVVFIGNIEPWHGLDKVILLAEKTIGRLQVDVIGCENPSSTLPPNLTFYGFLKKQEYLEVFRKCDVGLDGLSLYKKYMAEACPLKIREYLANGLPIVMSSEDTAFIGVEKAWILRIGNDPRNVSDSIDRIVEFARKMKGFRVAHPQVASYIDSRILETKRAKFIADVFNGFSGGSN